MSTLHVPVGITSVALQRDQFVCIGTPHPFRLNNRRGTLWITVDGEACDIVLSPGESVEFAGRAQVVVGAMGGGAAFEARRLPQKTRPRRLAALAHWLDQRLAQGLRQLAGRADATITRGVT